VARNRPFVDSEGSYQAWTAVVSGGNPLRSINLIGNAERSTSSKVSGYFEMTEIKRHLKQRHLKRRLARNSYTVDPEQVAAAIIVRLVLEDPDGDPGNGSSHARPSISPLRQAA
jgi:hypothetical protein